jgi:cytochrome P450
MSDAMDWSPFHPQIMEDPANGHHQLLDQCPVHHCTSFKPPFYTLSRYADVEAALRDIATFSSHFGQGPRFTDPQGMLADPPQHTFYRRLVQQAFTPRAIDGLREPVSTLTDELISTVLKGGGTFDLHDDLAFPLPVTIIANMLGVPASDLDRFKHWSDIQVAAMGAEDPMQYADDQADFLAYMVRHLRERRALIEASDDVPDDLLTLIAGARNDDGTLTPEADALSVLNQLLVGGNETTTSLITNAVWRLLEVPQRWQMLVDEPDLAASVVEESLRFDPPVLGLYRNTTSSVTLHGETIPERTKVMLNYAAANRDPRVFEAPDTFDPKREPKRHLAFGLGVHFCLGAPMARLEAEIVLTQLARRMPDLHLLNSGERIAPFFLWGRRHLPVSWA